MMHGGSKFVTIKLHIMTLYNTTFENFNKNYIGSATMAVIGQSCLGAAAAMYILSHGNLCWANDTIGNYCSGLYLCKHFNFSTNETQTGF